MALGKAMEKHFIESAFFSGRVIETSCIRHERLVSGLIITYLVELGQLFMETNSFCALMLLRAHRNRFQDKDHQRARSEGEALSLGHSRTGEVQNDYVNLL